MKDLISTDTLQYPSILNSNIFNYKDLEIGLDFYDLSIKNETKLIYNRDNKLKELGI